VEPVRLLTNPVLVALVALMFWKLPPWLVVAGSGIAGGLLSVTL